jgi:hypothetical protein
MLSDKAWVTPVQLMTVLNSKVTMTVVPFWSDEMRASWPGKNFVSAGRGGTHALAGTKTLKPYGSIVTPDRQPWNGALLSLLKEERESASV